MKEVRKTKETILSPKEKVLASVDRLAGRRDKYRGPTLDDIKGDLRRRYGTEPPTDRQLLSVLSELEEEGHVERERGVLSDKRRTVFSMTAKGEQIVLSLIKFGEEKGLVHNGWEGPVSDPPCKSEDFEEESRPRWTDVIVPRLSQGSIGIRSRKNPLPRLEALEEKLKMD